MDTELGPTKGRATKIESVCGGFDLLLEAFE